MKDEAARVREVAPHHARYWSETGSAERGGPFSDRSGGLIIIDAADEGAAGQLVANDPFQRAALLEQWWLKAWQPTEIRADLTSPEPALVEPEFVGRRELGRCTGANGEAAPPLRPGNRAFVVRGSGRSERSWSLLRAWRAGTSGVRR
jgi:hypothetical protein